MFVAPRPAFYASSLPVLGHAFVGWATFALAARTAAGRHREAPRLLPALVVAAYVPDIAGQLAARFGAASARTATHSVLFALLAGPLLASLAARAMPALAFAGRAALVTGSILLHDLLDMFQSTDRMPFWPFSHAIVGSERAIIPSSMAGELLTIGLPAAALATVVLWQRARRHDAPPVSAVDYTLAAAILAVALAVHAVRDRREDDVARAEALLEARQFPAALDALAVADRWPSPAKPGRVDYLRAEAYAGLGNRSEAERLYQRSYQHAPDYFWVVADLADFYAAGDGPRAERERRAAPYVSRLRSSFPEHPALADALERIDRHLSRP
jgi:membrane-bound metal-dependent hydrolase YbcI (DUF457 family)